jgi:hypothetical protein
LEQNIVFLVDNKRKRCFENRVEVGVKTVLERDLPHTSLLLLISESPVGEWQPHHRPLFPKPLLSLDRGMAKNLNQTYEGGVPGYPEQN